jgi:ubiquinone/menaquinone biosynthesis C-methylase UbiE
MQTNVEHYQSLAGVYRLFYLDYETSMEEEGARLAGLLHRLGAQTVLDACCGIGRQSIPLAQAGFLVVAADPCEAMLAEAERQAGERNLAIPWLLSDFESLPSRLSGAFDAVIALGNGLCHCPTRDAVVRALVALHRCCLPGGSCLVGIKDFDRLRGVPRQHHTYGQCNEGGLTSDLTQTWDVQEPQLICSTVLRRRETASGRLQSVVQAETREYMLGQAELREVAVEAGFRSVESLPHPGEAVYLLSA